MTAALFPLCLCRVTPPSDPKLGVVRTGVTNWEFTETHKLSKSIAGHYWSCLWMVLSIKAKQLQAWSASL